VTLEEDVSLWAKIIGSIIGAVTLIGTLLSVGKEWNSLKWRVKNMEDRMESIEASMLRMQEQASANTVKTLEAAQRTAVHAERSDGNVALILDAVEGLKERVSHLEQGSQRSGTSN
jgi:gas vesicle protein